MERKPRIYTRCEVELERLGRRAAGESENLSRGGVFVRTPFSIPPGTTVELVIRLPDGGDLCIISRVVHVLEADTARTLGRHPGIGFQFVDHDDRVYETLDRFLDSASEEEIAAPVREVRVLVAEPSLPLQERLQNALEAAGFGFHAVTTGAEAMALCEKRAPDLVIARARMHQPDGIALARALSQHPECRAIPVLLLSRTGSDMVRLAAYRAGAREVLDEPFTDEELVIRLRRLWADSSRAEIIEEITLDEPETTFDDVDDELLGQTEERVPEMSDDQAHVDDRFPEVAAVPLLAGLSGDLAQLSLATVLSILDLERKSGILRIKNAATRIHIDVEHGRIVGVDGVTGEAARDALMIALDCEDGEFSFSTANPTAASEASRGRAGDDGAPGGLAIQPVLLEHARLRDERGAK